MVGLEDSAHPTNRQIGLQRLNGIGPKCSATGPSMAAGKNSSDPTRSMVHRITKAKVTVSVRRVPEVNGVGFLVARLPARAMGATMGMKRPSSMTTPVAMSQGRL